MIEVEFWWPPYPDAIFGADANVEAVVGTPVRIGKETIGKVLSAVPKDGGLQIRAEIDPNQLPTVDDK